MTVLGALAAVVPMVRFEGLFLILVVGILFLVRRRIAAAVMIFALSIIPVVAYGLISISKGWYFFPNSILLKGKNPELSFHGLGRFVRDFIHQGFRLDTFHVYLLLVAGIVLLVLQLRHNKTFWRERPLLLTIFCGTVLLHLLFARAGWFFRYEAYLVVLGVMILSLATYDYFPHSFRSALQANRPAAIFLGLVAVVFLGRTLVALAWTPLAPINVYEQQYQMARFVRQFYSGQAVAANDIGAINYLADTKCLDLCGLTSLPVAKAIRGRCLDARKMDELAKSNGVKMAVIYEPWFKRKIPPHWTKVGQWTIRQNVVCGYPTVSFYAAQPSEIVPLSRNLKAFSPFLPRTVRQTGAYVK